MEIALHFTVYKILYFAETFSKSKYYCFCTIIYNTILTITYTIITIKKNRTK